MGCCKSKPRPPTLEDLAEISDEEEVEEVLSNVSVEKAVAEEAAAVSSSTNGHETPPINEEQGPITRLNEFVNIKSSNVKAFSNISNSQKRSCPAVARDDNDITKIRLLPKKFHLLLKSSLLESH